MRAHLLAREGLDRWAYVSRASNWLENTLLRWSAYRRGDQTMSWGKILATLSARTGATIELRIDDPESTGARD